RCAACSGCALRAPAEARRPPVRGLRHRSCNGRPPGETDGHRAARIDKPLRDADRSAGCPGTTQPVRALTQQLPLQRTTGMTMKARNLAKSLVGAVVALLVAGTASGEDLLSIYDRALANDLQIREAEANRRAQRQSRPLAIANLLPGVSATAGRQRNWGQQTFN